MAPRCGRLLIEESHGFSYSELPTMFRFFLTFLIVASLAGAEELFTFSENGVPRTYQLGESKGGILLYDQAALPAGPRLKAMDETQRVARMQSAARWLTSRILVREEHPARKLQTKAVSVEAAPVAGWSILTFSSPADALQAVRQMHRANWAFLPILAKQQAHKEVTDFSVPRRREVNDPLFPKQWHLQDAAEGQETGGLNLRSAWDYVTGKGINITIVDDGLEIGHVDLADNSYPLDSGYHRNFNEGAEGDPRPSKPDSHHGTSCAGLAAARGFNQEGLSGVAPEARLMGIRLIAGPATDEAEGLAFGWQPAGTVVHVSSNSWGPNDDGIDAGRQGMLAGAGMSKAATANRDGLGTVIVVSAGNGRASGDNSSYDGYASSRFALAVGAVNRQGQPSSYSEEGMNVAVSAFGGEFAPPDVIWTTNNSGDEAHAALLGKGLSQAPINYTDSFNGTSAAAPQVSGTVALLLERNPALHYRDVKEILLTTARKTGLRDGDPFVINGGGLGFSHSFGAGVVNVAKALEAADAWRSLGTLVSVERPRVGLDVAIPDGTAASEPVKFELADSNLRVEHVELTVTVAHALRGDLSFELVSPSGMRSVAQRRPNDDTKDFTAFTFTSVRHWGEVSSGTWELRAVDAVANGTAGALQSATLKVYGTAR